MTGFPEAACHAAACLPRVQWSLLVASMLVCCMTEPAAESRIGSRAAKARRDFLKTQTEWTSGGQTLDPTCDRDTGVTCNFHGCWLWQGPTECVRSGFFLGYKCLCLRGYCPSEHGVCEAAFGAVLADVVPVNAVKRSFPGHHAGANTGMCFSGGGIRAMTWALGGLRPLIEWDLMANVDVLSSVSGGSWASAIYMFAPGTTREVIGGPTDPKVLTMDSLNAEPPLGIKTATNLYLLIFLRLVLKGAPLDKIYEFFVCEAFLKPLGLCNMWAYMAPDAEAVVKIKSRNPQLEHMDFQIPRTKRPRAMVIQGTILGPLGYAVESGRVVSLQMSPDYVGSPFYPNGTHITYRSLTSKKPPLDRLVGGGFVSGFAFGGAPRPKGRGRGTRRRLSAPPWPFSLAQAIGISSMAPGTAMGNIPVVGKLTVPKHGYWPVADADHPSKHGMLITKLSDGGNLDNSGLLPLLQRGVKRAVWFAASNQLVDRSYDLCDVPIEGDYLIRAKIINEVLDKFGYGPMLSNPAMSLMHNQVFRRERVHNVVCQLQQHLNNGTPPVLSFTEEVLPNTWWGITGGWNVEVVLVYLERSADFEGLLPHDTRQQLAKGDGGPFQQYPAYATTIGGGTNAQYNLLAATSEYFVRQNEHVFKRILGTGVNL